MAVKACFLPVPAFVAALLYSYITRSIFGYSDKKKAVFKLTHEKQRRTRRHDRLALHHQRSTTQRAAPPGQKERLKEAPRRNDKSTLNGRVWCAFLVFEAMMS